MSIERGANFNNKIKKGNRGSIGIGLNQNNARLRWSGFIVYGSESRVRLS
jgi:hypothetical protein